MPERRFLAATLAGLLTWTSAFRIAHALSTDELVEMSLEELMQIEVTTPGKKTQKLSGVPAALFVLTQEDLHRSGATNIPDALRMVPGLQVARIDSSKWAVSARGFNGRFANKLLVLMDGRSVYTPTFSGVYWEMLDYPLQDIERIEVIRGPGAALWGANAVNGVINIITKSARDTQGGNLSLGTGTYERVFGSLRYGTRLGEHTYGRAYVKGFQRDSFDSIERRRAGDGWDFQRGGFRVDHDGTDGDSATLQGNMFRGTTHQQPGVPTLAPPYQRFSADTLHWSGFNLLGRWTHNFSRSSQWSLQAYYDHADRQDVIAEERNTCDLEFQHRFSWQQWHDIVWGLGYRYLQDRYSDNERMQFGHAKAGKQLFSAFLQDDFTLIQDRLKFTLGAKLEHNDFTGVEGQPNARLLWTPDTRHSVWASVSRAVRTPSRAEDDGSFPLLTLAPSQPPNPTPFPIRLVAKGNRDYRAEVVWAQELGYRFMPMSNLSFDLTLFYNRYDRLRSAVLQEQFSSARLPQVNASAANAGQGQSYGAELAVDWRPEEAWRLHAAYAYLNLDLSNHHDDTDVTNNPIEQRNPEQQWSLRSEWDIRHYLHLDLWLRYVDRIPTAGVPFPGFSTRIDDYLTLDARLAWNPWKDLELSVVGQNLLDDRHPEYAQEAFAPKLAEIPRGVYVKLDWRF